MYVKQLAKLMGVTADTVRHYTRIGLLHPIRSEENGYQEYFYGLLFFTGVFFVLALVIAVLGYIYYASVSSFI